MLSSYTVFAIQNGGACFSGPNAESTYKRYGPSDACKGGRGGAFANSVYKLFDDGKLLEGLVMRLWVQPYIFTIII